MNNIRKSKIELNDKKIGQGRKNNGILKFQVVNNTNEKLDNLYWLILSTDNGNIKIDRKFSGKIKIGGMMARKYNLKVESEENEVIYIILIGDDGLLDLKFVQYFN